MDQWYSVRRMQNGLFGAMPVAYFLDRMQPKQCYDSLIPQTPRLGPGEENLYPKGESYDLDQSGFRRNCSLLRNQLLRERTTLNLQIKDAHSDPRFCGRGWVSAVELRLRKLRCCPEERARKRA